MSLNILIHKPREGTVEIELFGRVVIGPDIEALSNVFDVLLGKHSQIVINMAQVDRLDARGIGCLVSAYANGRTNGTRVSLSNLKPRILELLVIVKLITVFDGTCCSDVPARAA